MQGRKVQTLRIRAHRPEQVRHATIELEDALRTASFGNLPRNGLVYIRRLDLGNIGARPGRAALSRQIERRLLSLPASAIRRITAADDLPDCEAAWFPTPAAALCAVVERIAGGKSLRAWYWRQLLGLDPTHRVVVNEATVIARAEQFAPPELTVTSVLRHINRLAALPRLAAQLPVPLLNRQRDWLQARVVTTMGRLTGAEVAAADAIALEPTLRAHATQPQRLVAALPAGLRRQVFDAMRREYDAAERLQWLLLVCHHLAERRLSPGQWEALKRATEEPGSVELSPGAVDGPGPSQITATDAPPSVSVTKSLARPASVVTALERETAATSAALRADARGADPDAPQSLRRRPFPDTDFDWLGSWLWNGQPTPVAGLIFLWPVWQHLGLARALQSHSWLAEAGFPNYLFKRLGQWLALDRQESMLSWLGPHDRDATGEWRAPAGWRDLLQPQLKRFGTRSGMIGGQRAEKALGGRVLLSLEGDANAAAGQLPALADSWLRLSARWLYGHELQIRKLVERPGAVALTDTHIDVCLPADHGELQIRTLGLDIDPGWQPALGKVIQYHYVRRENPDA